MSNAEVREAVEWMRSRIVLGDQMNDYSDTYKKTKTAIETLIRAALEREAQTERLVKALEWYADRDGIQKTTAKLALAQWRKREGA